jgi:hypothetical protein
MTCQDHQALENLRRRAVSEETRQSNLTMGPLRNISTIRNGCPGLNSQACSENKGFRLALGVLGTSTYRRSPAKQRHEVACSGVDEPDCAIQAQDGHHLSGRRGHYAALMLRALTAASFGVYPCFRTSIVWIAVGTTKTSFHSFPEQSFFWLHDDTY